ncbi:hypothetical protein A2U01_0008099, partial [Trifolium medium]|nr:hypothetical protein [Trifolium medium]
LGTVVAVCQLKLDMWIFISKSLISDIDNSHRERSVSVDVKRRSWVSEWRDGQTSTMGSFSRLCKFSTLVRCRPEDEGGLVGSTPWRGGSSLAAHRSPNKFRQEKRCCFSRTSLLQIC